MVLVVKESSEEKFVRLAEKRVNNAIKCMKLIGNLSNRTNYTYSDDDTDRIFDALNSELKACRGRFKQSSFKDDEAFSLKR